MKQLYLQGNTCLHKYHRRCRRIQALAEGLNTSAKQAVQMNAAEITTSSSDTTVHNHEPHYPKAKEREKPTQTMNKHETSQQNNSLVTGKDDKAIRTRFQRNNVSQNKFFLN